jgi:site-specific DNA recombinase
VNTIPERFQWVKEDFDQIAVKGFLGDPDGKPGMAYLRVSSTGQAEEGRSGFPRQLIHVHDKAKELGLAIPWELVFFDDHTGFEFRDRPALTTLRNLVKSFPRPADNLVIENLDRLSREATWHQGYLLEEFEKEHKLKVHFWKELGSKLERAVYGTITQDRMLTDLERMATGNLIKAKSGRVTARTPAYGYKLVDANGGEENAKKDTHYAVYEPEAKIIRLIYSWLVKERATLFTVSIRLTEKKIKPPKRSKAWDMTLLRTLVRNPVYKGEFYAHRRMEVKRISAMTGKVVKHKIDRPRSEWILVPVPLLVTPEVWAEAQKVMSQNRSKSRRNTKWNFLLVGLTHCAHCKTKMSSGRRQNYRNTREGLKEYDSPYYRCVSRNRGKHIRTIRGIECTMPQITARRLDEMAWNIVWNTLLDPQRLEEGMERYFSRHKVETTREEIAYIQSQITELDIEDERLYQAYLAKAFEADEFSQKRFALKEKKQKLEAEKEELQKRLSQQVGKEEKKRSILAAIEELKKKTDHQIPFELKRKLLLMVVDKITVNTQEEWLEFEGAISGKFDFIPADKDSWPQLVESWPETSARRAPARWLRLYLLMAGASLPMCGHQTQAVHPETERRDAPC